MDASIGSALRDARERHGLSIDTVAFELDVDPRHLRALEEDRLEQELGSALAATQAKLYAVFLGLDAKSLLAGLPPQALSTTSPASALSSRRAAGAGAADPGQPGGGSTLIRERGDESGTGEDDDTAELLVADEVEEDGTENRAESGATRVEPVDVAGDPPAGALADGAAADALVGDEGGDDLPDDVYRRRRAFAVVTGMLIAALLVSFTLSTLTGQPDAVELTDGGTAAGPAAPVEQPAEETDVATEQASDEAADDPSAAADDAAAEPPPIAPADAADTRVQVLDGVGDRVAYQDAIAYLEDLGYQILRSGGSGREYARTTLFFTSSGAEQAASLAAYDPLRFPVVRPNDRGLSEQLELHLVVGADWPTGDRALLTDG